MSFGARSQRGFFLLRSSPSAYVSQTGLKFGARAADRCRMKVASSDARKKSRIAFLNEEMDELHRADGVYWRGDLRSDRAAEAQYRFRQQRLKAIREELEQLRLQP
jgi:hypothetical protein